MRELRMVELLRGKQVTMIQDGWSNVHNHPIIATCLHLPTSGDGGKKSIFAGSIDTGAEKKTANYISDLAIKQIGQFEDKYKCKVVAYISDNENKMKLTRQLLETHYKEVDARGNNLGLLAYGCATNYLNLVEKEVTPRTVLSHLLQSDSCSFGRCSPNMV
ncbi:hypothetical protein Avbf_15666 [Armadillidium vulgare]|nr:hypothetical protein Avbf_15666 [Armadillidium vulgare]